MESGGEKDFCCPNWEVVNGEDESEVKYESCTVKDGGSSSSSTVEEGEKKPSVRPYVRSKMPRLRWTPDLHLRFVQAVERLGGQERATPKSVLQLMEIKGLKIAHIKSHLQMYRSKKINSESSQGMTDHMLFMDDIDQNIFNLSLPPFLPNHTHGQTSKLWCGASASWNVDGKSMGNGTVHQNSCNKINPGFYSPIIGRIFNNKFCRSAANLDLCSKITSFNGESTPQTDEHFKQPHGSAHIQEFCSRLYQSTQNPSVKMIQRLHGQRMSSDTVKNPSDCQRMTRETAAGTKRKGSNYELDLNLSLGNESRNKEEQQGIVLDDDEQLNMSGYRRRMLKANGIVGVENARGMSTLDLTL